MAGQLLKSPFQNSKPDDKYSIDIGALQGTMCSFRNIMFNNSRYTGVNPDTATNIFHYLSHIMSNIHQLASFYNSAGKEPEKAKKYVPPYGSYQTTNWGSVGAKIRHPLFSLNKSNERKCTCMPLSEFHNFLAHWKNAYYGYMHPFDCKKTIAEEKGRRDQELTMEARITLNMEILTYPRKVNDVTNRLIRVMAQSNNIDGVDTRQDDQISNLCNCILLKDKKTIEAMIYNHKDSCPIAQPTFKYGNVELVIYKSLTDVNGGYFFKKIEGVEPNEKFFKGVMEDLKEHLKQEASNAGLKI